MNKIKLGPTKVRKQVSPYVIWTKDELAKPPKYILKFPKQFLTNTII